MDKKELLEQLQQSNRIEEEFVSIMSYFLQNIVDNLSLDPPAVKRISNSLKKLEQDSLKHKVMVQDLIEYVTKGQRNEY